MKLELGKTYKMSNGRHCRVICTDRKRTLCGVPAPILVLISPDDEVAPAQEDGALIGIAARIVGEYDPWADVPIDAPIWVKNTQDGDRWLKRHFAGVQNGKVLFWPYGQTSFTAEFDAAPSYYGTSLTDPALEGKEAGMK